MCLILWEYQNAVFLYPVVHKTVAPDFVRWLDHWVIDQYQNISGHIDTLLERQHHQSKIQKLPGLMLDGRTIHLFQKNPWAFSNKPEKTGTLLWNMSCFSMLFSPSQWFSSKKTGDRACKPPLQTKPLPQDLHSAKGLSWCGLCQKVPAGQTHGVPVGPLRPSAALVVLPRMSESQERHDKVAPCVAVSLGSL